MPPTLLDRRVVLRGGAALGLATPFAGLRRRAAVAATAPVPRRVYFDDPDYQNVQISPDGGSAISRRSTACATCGWRRSPTRTPDGR